MGGVLVAGGHVVIYHREALDQGAKDPIVCQTAMQNDAILVAVDGDMKQLSKRFGKTDDRFVNLNLLMCGCGPVQAATRVSQALSLIEHEWQFSEQKVGRRLWIDLEKHWLVTYR